MLKFFVLDREQVHVKKLLVRTTEKKNFLTNCPEQYEQLMINIDQMVFSDMPNYSFFYKTLIEVIGISFNKKI